MSLYRQLDRLAAATRHILICETAVPCLPEWHAHWSQLPFGRPDGLDRETRYLLAIYRAALAQQREVRQWLRAHRAEQWLAAVEAEATLLWQIEREHLGPEWSVAEEDDDALLAVA
jgi:hypothetical protein